MNMMHSNSVSTHLKSLRLSGMHKAYDEQLVSSGYQDMSFDDRLSFLLDREAIERDNKALQTRIGKARFKGTATLEDMQVSTKRGLDKGLLMQLSQCGWVKDRRNIVITGPSGCGKTFLSTALSRKACQLGSTARYFRANNLLAELEAAREEGSFIRTVASLGRPNVLIIDDFCLSSMSETEEKDLFELIEERHGKVSTIFTSQNPVGLWHSLMPNPAIADAILDRIVHTAVRIELKGESMRKGVTSVLDSEVLKQS